MNKILVGCYDLHVHTAPDVIPRKCSDMQLAERIALRGMKGMALKAHFSDTADRAQLVRERYPGMSVVGGVVLNRTAGGINPEAVMRCAQAGGKMVWFPTLDARSYQWHVNPQMTEEKAKQFLTVLDENGELIPAARMILEMASEHAMIVGTGHLSAEEGLALVHAASAYRTQMVLTHADNPADRYTIEQQQEAVRLGAVVEHSFYTVYYGETIMEDLVRQIRAVGCENVLLTTDFGQVASPFPDEGLELFSARLLEAGFTEKELYTMICFVPERLLSLH